MRLQTRTQERIRTVLACALFLILTSCANDLKFSGTSTDTGASTSTQITGADQITAGLLVYETKSDFVTTSNTALDLVWVIDDSGSMQDDIDRVKTNFGAFVSSMQQISDFKMALITQKQASSGNPNFLDLSALVTGPNVLQIDTPVDSHNALAVTAATLCPDRSGACAQSKIDASPNNSFGRLLSFLRPSSKKAFIFVTDDNANIGADQFINAFKRSYPNQTPTTYAFIGIGGGASPCQAATGTNYEDLSTRTGGAYFNICGADWRATYVSIVNNVIQLAQNTVQIPANISISKIAKVAINGTIIDPSHYTISGDGIVFDSAILKRGVLATVSIYYNP